MPGAWYASLAKPSWTPPNAIFAPVWTVLYVLMGVAAWLAWRRAGFSGAAQLWPCSSSSSPSTRCGRICSSDCMTGHRLPRHRRAVGGDSAVVVLFWRVDRVAGTLMLPYLVWVGFASCLNFALWRLNAGNP